MDFERLYGKLPDFIKYNSSVLNFFLSAADKLRSGSKTSKQMESHQELLNILFTSCDIKMKGLARDIQLLYLELFKFIDNVCRKYDIDYWMDYGTLLGAVRHGGFIPWDDDIDLSILRKDYNKLIEVLPKEIDKFPELKENCGLSLIIENGENHFNDFRSVYDLNDETNLISLKKFSFLQFAWMKPYLKIDFFPKDYIEEDKIDLFNKKYMITKYRFNEELKRGNITFKEGLEQMKKETGLTDEKTKYLTDSLDVINTSPIYIYKTDKIFPLKTVKFEGMDFKCPNDIAHVLEESFGKRYMEIPNTIDNHSLKKFIQTQFQSKEEMEKTFRKSIDCLKKINSTYFNCK
ncbi:MAG: LicD family protein [Methanobrevibacter sp.]|uniref:LicD family protein n=1 Tax=Methanobrevibacter sp. TaxID=66852 RepID=UPI0026DF37B9|nr:LicD family protein [Methanobrevibacter sp.]MDO5849564.1 LicD family protein [Methanobrevibacter sp.]